MSNPLSRSSSARLAAVLSAILLVVSACGGGTGSGAAQATKTPLKAEASEFADKTAETSIEIDVIDNAFSPNFVTITAGTKVTWKSSGENTHNVLPSDNGAFKKSEDLHKGDSYSVTFDAVGDYGYYCSHHGGKVSGQHGGIRVVAKK